MESSHEAEAEDIFLTVAKSLEGKYTNPKLEALWSTSPYNWIRTKSPRSKGAISETMIEELCKASGLQVLRSKDSQADRIIEGKRVEIKFSLLWEDGNYTFQQIRDQNYEYAIFLGISPGAVHCWLVSKDVLLQYVIGHLPQHKGKEGSDTFWVFFIPDKPPEWLADQPGTPEYCLSVLRSFR